MSAVFNRFRNSWAKNPRRSLPRTDSTRRGLVLADPIGALARLQLERALAQGGEKEKSKAAYADFLSIWHAADSDVPILREARTEFAELK